jgi:hypothetical protein
MIWRKVKRFWPLLLAIVLLLVCWHAFYRTPASSVLTGDATIDSLLVANDRVNAALRRKDWKAIRGELRRSAALGLVFPLAVDAYPDARRRGYVVTTFITFRALAYSRSGDTATTMNLKRGLWYFLPIGPSQQSYHYWIQRESQFFLTDFDDDPYYEGSGRKRPTRTDSGWVPIQTE